MVKHISRLEEEAKALLRDIFKQKRPQSTYSRVNIDLSRDKYSPTIPTAREISYS